MLRLTFPDQTAANANRLASALTARLQLEGLVAPHINIVPERPDAMGFGEVIHIAEITIGLAVVVKHIYELCVRERCVIEFASENGHVVFDVRGINDERSRELRELLEQFLRNEKSS